MNIQSLSVVVPTGQCWNDCAYCVSRQHSEDYGCSIIRNHEPLPKSYINKLEYVREEGCNNMIITGTAEPQQNMSFIYYLLRANTKLRKPFYNISIQTTGSGLGEPEIHDFALSGMTTLALSISALNNNAKNWEIIGTPQTKRTTTTEDLIELAHNYNMIVRLCLNLTDSFKEWRPQEYFEWAAINGIEQLTFRKMYAKGNSEKAAWVKQHEFPEEGLEEIKQYVVQNGIPVARLPYGFVQYDVNGISTVVDTDCMSENNIEEIRYAILRPNGHLYSSWNLKGSLIF